MTYEACFTHRHITEACGAVGSSLIGGLESLKCHFLDFGGSFDRIVMVRKQRFSMSKFTICLQFSRTKWAKAYLMNYILEKLQERVWVI
jgi:hypothetical protein